MGAKQSKPKRKSSVEARQLIRAAVRRTGSHAAAARALGLPNAAQAWKMLHGKLGDTPAMRAALLQANERARRAFLQPPAANPADRYKAAHDQLLQVKKRLAVIEAIFQDREEAT